MKTYFRYFISYYFKVNGHDGFANHVITLEDELNDWQSVQNISRDLEDKYELDDVIILNWKPLK